ncbi:MAG: Dabb family protein, partial [Bacteroidota bacterium]
MKNQLFYCFAFMLLIACSNAEKTREATTETATAKVMEQKSASTKKLRHVVLFQFKEGTSEADIQKV